MTQNEQVFYNRVEEFKLLDGALENGGLYVIYGRRRIGKSRFLREFTRKKKGVYFQALKTTTSENLNDLWKTIEPASEMDIVNWKSFFEALEAKILAHKIEFLVIDEFPFLVETSPELPSQLQRWCDNFLDSSKFLLIISGSGQKMMHSTFLNGNEPLYGRAKMVYKMPYLSYKWYLKYLNEKHSIESFSCFSLLGGVPRYWLLSNKMSDPVELADYLYFSDSASLQDEATRLLYDEGLYGHQPSLILDLIGRGATKPSDISSALAQSQGSLSKPLKQLLDIGLIKKENPFGQSPDNSKIVHLSISDSCLKFWFAVASPHKNRWHTYSKSEKLELIHLHGSVVWEDYVRTNIKGARYWEKNIEIDSVSLTAKNKCLVTEIKFSELASKQKAAIAKKLEQKWHQSNLSKMKLEPQFQVLDIKTIY